MDAEELRRQLVSGKELRRIYRARKPKDDFTTVRIGKESSLIEEGWVVGKKSGKKSLRMWRPKEVDRAFEDSVWCLFANLGFPEMNRDRNMRIKIVETGPGKQIDVFAKDDETVLIIECKICEGPRRRDLQKDMGEVVALREDVRRLVKEAFGNSIKMEWIFATKNVIWSEPDLNRANHFNISVLQERDIDYFTGLTNHIGVAAKYQLLAEIFKKKDIPNLDTIVPAIKGRMGNSHFYAFAIEPSKLLKIGFICHRMKGNDDKTILMYQRMLEKKRIREIRKYVDNGGVFPNSIVVNLDSGKDDLRFDQLTTKGDGEESTRAVLGMLHLPNMYKSAFIIDGQHRLYGYSDSPFANKTQIPVIAFEHLGAKEQADIFVDINSKQKKVNRNLLEDLVADTKWGSDKWSEKLQALTSKTFSELGEEPFSPFYKRISRTETKKEQEAPLTMASLTNPLRNSNLLGSVRKSAKEEIFLPGPLYAKDMESSLKRSVRVLSEYFREFQVELSSQWDLGSAPGGYICTNGGVTALIAVLKAIVEHIDKKATEKQTLQSIDMTTDDLIENIKIYSRPVIDYFKAANTDTIKELRKRVGASGHQSCAYQFMVEINKVNPDFMNQGLRTWMDEKYSESNEEAKIIMPKIQLIIANKIISELKAKFGENEEGWWVKGVPPTVRQKVVIRREEDPERPPLEASFDLIHYKLVLLQHWTWLGHHFSRGTGTKENQLIWMNDLNRIRNRIAHPEKGMVTSKDLSFLNEIYPWLDTKIRTIEIENPPELASEG